MANSLLKAEVKQVTADRIGTSRKVHSCRTNLCIDFALRGSVALWMMANEDQADCSAILSAIFTHSAVLAVHLSGIEQANNPNRIFIRRSFSNATRNLIESEFVRAFRLR